MDTDLQHIIDWLGQQTADKTKRIAAWCRHGYGKLSIKQEAGAILEINGFKYARRKQEKKLID